MVRLTRYISGGPLPLELLPYVDDFLFIAESREQVEAIVFALYVMSLVGVPFRWKKFKGGADVGWIGY